MKTCTDRESIHLIGGTEVNDPREHWHEQSISKEEFMSAEDHEDVGGNLADLDFARQEAFYHTDEEGRMAEDLAEGDGTGDGLDFLVEDEHKSAMEIQKDLAKMAETLTELEFKYITAQEKMEQAKKLYDEFRCVTLPNAFRMAGVLGIETTQGARVMVERKYYCTPNKGEEDQKIMMNWLEKNGGNDLIKRQAIVDAAQIQKLIEAKIPHSQKKEVNTQSLKAWLKRCVGENKNVATIKIEDIPPCMHFVCLDEAVVKL